MPNFKRSTLPSLVLALLTVAAIACSDSSSSPVVSTPLAGLLKSQSNDSAPGNGPPVTPTPGTIHGMVRGQAEATGTGVDTVANAPRVANVQVTAYAGVTSGTAITAGNQVAQTTTNANGEFQLPTLPGGVYVVTFIPPADGKYRGVYVSGTVSSLTDQYPWYIVLSKK